MRTNKRRLFSLALLLVLSILFVLPVSAAKPSESSFGLLWIANSSEDILQHMAVCVSEEDGNYVYAGVHPIQQQVCLYSTVTGTLSYNSIYELEEDTEYDAIKGVYRFALGETVDSGSEADIFPKMASVKRNDNVYFVKLDLLANDPFVIEKTQVSSVRKGQITTKDSLEKESKTGEFSVIFNDSGNVVGFCKSGAASAAIVKNTPSISPVTVISACVAAAVTSLVVFLIKRKQSPQPPIHIEDNTFQQNFPDSDRTVLDSDTNAFPDSPFPAMGSNLLLKCHGGYLNGRIYPIPPEGITVGREPDNHIRYPMQTPGISRHHIQLFWKDGQLFLVDLGSSNGTFLKTTGRISPKQPVPLNPGDIFYLGEKINGFEISNQ